MLRRLLPETVQIRMGELPMGYTLSLDTGALEQIMANLCTNARDAMPQGGTISITSDTETLDAHAREAHPWLDVGEYFRITVRDTGVGMTDETLRRIFEPFYTTKPLGTGTGLGMAMVYGLMKSHHGMVDVSSTPGAGTSVSLHFPIVTGVVATDVQDVISQPTVAPGGHEGILIVEDDAAIRNATRRALESKGYHVWVAADGAEGLAVYRANRQDVALVLSDLVMPNMTGREMAGALRAAGASVPVLFASGYSADWIYGDMDLPDDVHFLPKPWTLTTLFLRVREVLDSTGERAH
jgi:CheY-like chemotaxis protein